MTEDNSYWILAGTFLPSTTSLMGSPVRWLIPIDVDVAVRPVVFISIVLNSFDFTTTVFTSFTLTSFTLTSFIVTSFTFASFALFEGSEVTAVRRPPTACRFCSSHMARIWRRAAFLSLSAVDDSDLTGVTGSSSTGDNFNISVESRLSRLLLQHNHIVTEFWRQQNICHLSEFE